LYTSWVKSGRRRVFSGKRELPDASSIALDPEPFLLDLEMLVMTPGGRERTRSEFAKLLSDAQFELVNVFPTISPLKLFEARPV